MRDNLNAAARWGNEGAIGTQSSALRAVRAELREQLRLLFAHICEQISELDQVDWVRNPHQNAVTSMVRMSSVTELQARLVAFREERNWERFHDPKSLAAALGAEVGELLEQVMWLSTEQARSLTAEQTAAIRDEVADIAIFALHLANSVGFDLGEAVDEKLKVVAERIPPSQDAPARKADA